MSGQKGERVPGLQCGGHDADTSDTRRKARGGPFRGLSLGT